MQCFLLHFYRAQLFHRRIGFTFLPTPGVLVPWSTLSPPFFLMYFSKALQILHRHTSFMLAEFSSVDLNNLILNKQQRLTNIYYQWTILPNEDLHFKTAAAFCFHVILSSTRSLSKKVPLYFFLHFAILVCQAIFSLGRGNYGDKLRLQVRKTGSAWLLLAHRLSGLGAIYGDSSHGYL